MLIIWRDAAPERLAGRLERLGFGVRRRPAGSGFELAFGAVEVLITAPPGPREAGLAFGRSSEIGAQLGTDPPAHRQPNGVTDVAAIGLATVDLQRTAAELPGVRSWLPGRDDALGAAALVDPAAQPVLALLEPATEGRLAAALARFGEGPAALYLRLSGAPVASLVDELEQPRAWPLGSTGRLLRPDRPWGPFLVLVADEAATLSATSARGAPARPAPGGHPPAAAASGRPGRPAGRS